MEIQKKIAELEKEAKRLEYEQGKREAEILQPLLDDDDVLQDAFHDACNSPLFKDEWSGYADDIGAGMKESEFFKAAVRISIKQEHLDKFAQLDNYQQSIEKTESQIAQLKTKLRG